ncbi:U6 snRNA-associated Sm-like protein LSm1 isoform X2 [Macrotis lagotis]|uniref:U6 snRNA-associated Sm-like protein LSm1 isoform X2 n=1 Tax=Macrotis lagotis TaxID=92651 RepID=UPI003D69249E
MRAFFLGLEGKKKTRSPPAGAGQVPAPPPPPRLGARSVPAARRRSRVIPEVGGAREGLPVVPPRLQAARPCRYRPHRGAGRGGAGPPLPLPAALQPGLPLPAQDELHAGYRQPHRGHRH